MPLGRRDHQAHGFTIVEVVIAMLLLVVVIGAVAMAAVGSNRVHGRTQVRAKMSATAEQIYERVRSNRTWMAGCRDTCDLRRHAELDLAELGVVGTQTAAGRSDDGEPTFVLDRVEAQPIDTPADRTGRRDLDGITPDYYRLKIVLRLQQADMTRLGRQAPLVLESTLDPAGTESRGSLVVQMCTVLNQVDERMSINNCDNPATNLKMADCPRGSRPACNAYDAVAARTANPFRPTIFVSMRHQRARFTIRGRSAGTSDVRRNQSDAVYNAADGTYTFYDLPAGEYRIDPRPPAGLAVWDSHSIPAAGELAVEERQRSRALVLFRPKSTGTFHLYFQRSTMWFDWSAKSFVKRFPEQTKPYRRTTGDCTAVCRIWYGQTHINHTAVWRYYSLTTATPKILQGSSEYATYRMDPEPTGRYATQIQGRGTCRNNVYSNPTVRVPCRPTPYAWCTNWRSSTPVTPIPCVDITGAKVANYRVTTRPTKHTTIAGLPAGLNSWPLLVSNSYLRQISAGCCYTWVRPDGSMLGANSARYQGKGECYRRMRGVYGWRAYSSCTASCVQWPWTNGMPCAAAIVYSVCTTRTSYAEGINRLIINDVPKSEPYAFYQPRPSRTTCRGDVSHANPLICSSVIGGCRRPPRAIHNPDSDTYTDSSYGHTDSISNSLGGFSGNP